MDTKDAAQRLAEAKAKLARERRRLHALQRATILGSGDPAALDAAVLAHRRARAEAAAAQAAWAEWRATQPHGLDPTPRARLSEPPHPAAAGEPSPRFLFAQWLLEAARLREWQVA